MKKTIYLVILGLIFISICIQCSKDEKSVSPTFTNSTTSADKSKMLAGTSSKSYKISQVMSNGINVTNQVPPCQKNSLFKFYANGNLFVLSGTPKCNATDPDTLTATTWKFNAAQDSLIFGKPVAMGINSAKLSSISDNSFTLTSTIQNLGGVIGDLTFEAQ